VFDIRIAVTSIHATSGCSKFLLAGDPSGRSSRDGCIVPLRQSPAVRQKEAAMSQATDFACIEACNECAVACNHCAAACLKEHNVEMMSRCIALDMDCAAICQFAAAAIARGSEYAKEICGLCANICEACAEECGKHTAPHCQACATACRACAVACLEMTH